MKKKDKLAKKSVIKKNYKIFLLLILLFTLSIRLYFFVGFCCGDDMAYVNSAYYISLGNYKTTGIYDSRIAFVYPISLFYRLLGVSDFTTVLYQILISLGEIIVIFYLGKLVFNESVGLISAFLLSIFPLDILASTMLVNDIVIAFYFSLSVYFFVLAEKRMGGCKYYVLSGIFYGISFLVKSSAIVFGLFYPVYFIFKDVLNFNFFDVQEEQHLKIKKSYFLLVILFLLFLALWFYFFNKTYPPAKDITMPIKPPIVSNATKLYGPNTTWINAFSHDENIYWDIDTNLLTNKASRGSNGIVEELEYSLNNDSQLHTLSKSLMANVNEPFETVNCYNKNFSESLILPKIGTVLCSETSSGNYAKIKIISFNSSKVGIKYELQNK
jgi:hypothetical protein